MCVCVCAHTTPGRWLLKASGSTKGRITSRLSATNHFPSAQPPCLPVCLSVCRSVCLFSPPPQAAVCLHHSYVLCLTTRLETFHWSSFRQRAEILRFCSYVFIHFHWPLLTDCFRVSVLLLQEQFYTMWNILYIRYSFVTHHRLNRCTSEWFFSQSSMRISWFWYI